MAKLLAGMAIDLLGDSAAGARAVLAQAKPPMTREAYLAFQRGLARRATHDAEESVRTCRVAGRAR